MKRLSLICFLSACAVLAGACSNSGGVTVDTGTGGGGSGRAVLGTARELAVQPERYGEGGASGSGSAGISGRGGAAGGAAGRGAGGTNGGASGAGVVCPGVQPLSGPQCRTVSDCPGSVYMCTSDPISVSSVCATNCVTPPPQHGCTDDTGCPTGQVCLSSRVPCWDKPSTACLPACTATSCSATQRCNAAGHCEAFPCANGFTCPAARSVRRARRAPTRTGAHRSPAPPGTHARPIFNALPVAREPTRVAARRRRAARRAARSTSSAGRPRRAVGAPRRRAQATATVIVGSASRGSARAG